MQRIDSISAALLDELAELLDVRMALPVEFKDILASASSEHLTARYDVQIVRGVVSTYIERIDRIPGVIDLLESDLNEVSQ